jgi:hypothetical protein
MYHFVETFEEILYSLFTSTLISSHAAEARRYPVSL